MGNSYAWAHIVHLFCALVFAGGVFFEVLVLSALHRQDLDKAVRRQAEAVLSRRARTVMPWVVALLFISGLWMIHRYATLLLMPWSSAFGLQLTIKILLAISVLGHFVVAVGKMRRASLTAAWSRYIHMAVLVQIILIVLLAKTMFYIA